MNESQRSPWLRHFDVIGDELMRLAIACEVQLRQPDVVDRVLKNDASVCGRNNPIGFRKLRELLMAAFGSIDKAVDRIGPAETKLLIDAIIERLDRQRELGGSAPARSPTAPDK
jgi:hypothetical protein